MEGFGEIEKTLAALDDAAGGSAEERFEAMQCLHVVRGAHQHFMGMAGQGPQSWNARARHMKHTVGRLMDHYGEGARGIVWAHNTHIGDARATSMAARGEVNIGHLAREKRGADKVFALGFATHRGSVKAGRRWGAERLAMTVPPATAGSLEAALNDAFPEGALLTLGEVPDHARQETVPHRAIGVIYHPEAEAGNYVPSRLAARYDALIFLPETQALTPLGR